MIPDDLLDDVWRAQARDPEDALPSGPVSLFNQLAPGAQSQPKSMPSSSQAEREAEIARHKEIVVDIQAGGLAMTTAEAIDLLHVTYGMAVGGQIVPMVYEGRSVDSVLGDVDVFRDPATGRREIRKAIEPTAEAQAASKKAGGRCPGGGQPVAVAPGTKKVTCSIAGCGVEKAFPKELRKTGSVSWLFPGHNVPKAEAVALLSPPSPLSSPALSAQADMFPAGVPSASLSQASMIPVSACTLGSEYMVDAEDGHSPYRMRLGEVRGGIWKFSMFARADLSATDKVWRLPLEVKAEASVPRLEDQQASSGDCSAAREEKAVITAEEGDLSESALAVQAARAGG